MAAPAYLISSSKVITLYFNGKAYSIDQSHPNHGTILSNLKAKDYSNLASLVDIPQTINDRLAVTANAEGVKVADGVVTYNGVPVHNVVVDRILDFLRVSLPFAPLVKFLSNLMENPSDRSRDCLYKFLEHNGHPITEDGCFLAYKYVRDDYKDKYSGTFDNSPGKTVKMPRNEVDPDPNSTCSRGLHVATSQYAAGQSGGSKLIVVKVNPRDVVAVPTDYDNQKMRVCEYYVVKDYDGVPLKQEDVIARTVDSDENDTYMDDDGGETCSDCDYPVDECQCDYDEDYDDDDNDLDDWLEDEDDDDDE